MSKIWGSKKTIYNVGPYDPNDITVVLGGSNLVKKLDLDDVGCNVKIEYIGYNQK